MKRSKYKPYIVFILISLGVGALGGIITALGMPAYEAAQKPSFTPPPVLFPIVWTILYILMGIGAARVYKTRSPGRDAALAAYGAQLFINFLWTTLFFGLHAYLTAFVCLVLLTALVAWMVLAFYRVDKPAGLLQLPYLLWCIFAAVLNYNVWLLN